MAQDPAGDSQKRRRLSVWLASATAVVGLATGVLTLRDQLFGSDPESPPPATSATIPYFDSVAGHLERSDDLLGTPPLTEAEREQVELGISDALPPPRCLVWQLWVGPDTDESGVYVTHGAPRIEGTLWSTSGTCRWDTSRSGSSRSTPRRQGPEADAPGLGSVFPSLTYSRQSGYSSLRQARGSSGGAFGVRSSRNELYGATNGSGALTV